MFKKRSLALLISILLIGGCCVSLLSGCSKTENKTPFVVSVPDGEDFVFDESDVLSNSEEARINTYLQKLEDKTGTDFVVLADDSFDSNILKDCRLEVSKRTDGGSTTSDNCVFLVVSHSDSNVCLKVGNELEKFLTPDMCNKILDNYFSPYQKEGDYVTAIDETVQAVIAVISEESGVTIDGVDSDIGIERKTISSYALGIIVIIVLLSTCLVSVDMYFNHKNKRAKEDNSSK